MNEKQKLFTRHSIGTRIAALFMLLILVITGVMTYVSIRSRQASCWIAPRTTPSSSSCASTRSSICTWNI